jgi:two-component system, chemotaxis family, chemotaxis protein CheY
MSQPRKVLVLEDSTMMCSIYRMVLAAEGRELIFARDGVEGLDRAAAEGDVDLYIVDVNLPRLDGISFIRRLRSELGAEAPVVVVSTECGEQDQAVAREAGADAYLCKPWTPEELKKVIDAMPEPV